MIGRLQGFVLEKQPPHLLLDVHGVGYDLLVPMTSFYHLPELGKEVVLHTHFAVSETSQQLFGFYQKEDRGLFRQLIKVSGVGPKMALAILSGMETSDFVRCVTEDKVAALVKVPGVGKKTAERLIIEMRDKLKGWEFAPGQMAAGEATATPRETTNSLIAEAESALVALGYKPAEAARAVSAVLNEHAAQRSEDIIRLALRAMLPEHSK